MAISAEIVLDSVSPDGFRLISIEGVLHRYIWPQVLAHSSLVRNSSSSRATPVNKNLAKVLADPCMPLYFGKSKAGMQAVEEIEDIELAKTAWLRARDNAVTEARSLLDLGCQKEVANRLIEPFLWHKVMLTGDETSWQHFFDLRLHHDAQKEAQIFAECVHDALQNSVPKQLGWNEWHTPWIRGDEHFESIEQRKQVSCARCARVSYETHKGVRDISEDVRLYHQLFSEKPEHASPGAHVAIPCRGHFGGKRGYQHLGAFKGFDQFRHEVEHDYDYS